MATPTLDIALLDTHSLTSIAILDLSSYPANWVNTNPSIEITPPGFASVILDFTPSSLQVFKSTNLGVACAWCEESDLPDGIWTFKYSVYPSYKYYVEKTFVKVDRLQEKLDEAFLTLDISECDESIKKSDKVILSNVQDYLEMAVAAGNKCVFKLFNTYYNKASTLLNNFIKRKSCVQP